jgi:aspartyl-tRNA(Asn)/glutamyl-tRNA(Gln) amidotransferase subunit B
VKASAPEFRPEKMERYKTEYGIPDYDIELITATKKTADIFEEATKLCGQPKKVSNWLMVETMRLLKEKNMDAEDIVFSPAHLADLINLVDKKVINNNTAKQVFEVMFENDTDPVKYVEEN